MSLSRFRVAVVLVDMKKWRDAVSLAVLKCVQKKLLFDYGGESDYVVHRVVVRKRRRNKIKLTLLLWSLTFKERSMYSSIFLVLDKFTLKLQRHESHSKTLLRSWCDALSNCTQTNNFSCTGLQSIRSQFLNQFLTFALRTLKHIIV